MRHDHWRPRGGGLLRRLAFAHAAFGIAFYRRELRAIARAGIVGAVPLRGPKSTAFWFLMPAPALWMAGRAASVAEEAHDAEALRAAHRVGLATALTGIACMPVSGFWLFALISLRGLREARAMRA
jgi:hypothetical protein